jgi:hypothetical protein
MTRFCSDFNISRFCSLTAVALVLGCAAAGTRAGTAAAVASPAAAEAAGAARSTPLTTELGALTLRGLTTMGVTRMGGSLYVLGGYFGQPHKYSKEFQSADFARLDVATGNWEQLPSAGALQSVIHVDAVAAGAAQYASLRVTPTPAAPMVAPAATVSSK